MSSPSPRQQILDLGQTSAFDRASLLVSECNRAAVGWIDLWPNWPTHALVLHGPLSSGKTHLGRIWGLAADALTLTPDDLSPALLSGIAATPRNVILEAANECGDHEQALFHLYNLIKETRRSLLLIARTPPSHWQVTLPDLASRLGAIPVVGIEQPDDTLLTTLLAKLFSDRQLVVPPDVLAFLVPRMERSFAAAERVAADLDALSLTHQRKLTVALARMALKEDA